MEIGVSMNMELKRFVQKGMELSEIADDTKLRDEYDDWCRNVNGFLKQERVSKEVLYEIQVKMRYTVNEFSKEETRKNIMRAIKDTIGYLEDSDISSETKMSKDTGIMLIERILNNFYLYYKSMFQNPLHQKSTLSMDDLKRIQIGNEYDLQRMLYSLLVPVFPMIRQEVESDNGYGGMRADLYLEEYDLIIEIKCTRDNMREKKLIEELGADGFLYQARNIIFFVYDKSNIIKNTTAFKAAFTKEENNGKTIEVIIQQPVKL